MARPTFTPDDEQRRTLDALARLARRRAVLVADADTKLDQLIEKAAGQDIPVNHIATAARHQRKTVYRRLGRPMR